MARAALSLTVTTLLGAGALGACLTLTEKRENVCGNLVHETGEDCDGYPVGEPPTVGTLSCNAATGPHACRMSCADGNVCPIGWRCGASDGVCRRASGTFAAPVSLDVPAREWLSVADINGNGIEDITSLNTGELTVFFMNESGEVGSTYKTPISARGRAAVGHMTRDETIDIVVPTSEGIAVLRGSSHNTIVPTTYTSFNTKGSAEDLVAIDAVPESLSSPGWSFTGDDPLIVDDDQITLIKPGQNPIVITGLLPQTALYLAAPIVAANFAQHPIAALDSEEFAIAYWDEAKLYVYGLTATADAGAAPELTLAELGANLPLAVGAQPGQISLPAENYISAPSAAEFDDPSAGVLTVIQLNPPSSAASRAGTSCDTDSHPDVIVAAHTTDVTFKDSELFASYAVGDGRFHSNCTELDELRDDTQGVTIRADMRFAPLPQLANCRGIPRAAGYLDGDDALDLVLPNGIWLSQAGDLCEDGQSPTIGQPTSGTQWSEAVIADINGDGRDDAICTVDPGSGLDLFIANDSPHMNHTRVSTEQHASQLQVGDFDGDLLLDVAMRQLTGGSKNALTIAYGKPFGVLDPPVEVGALETIEFIRAMHLSPQNENWLDGIDDLVVASRPEEHDAFAILHGRSDRQLQAPFALQYPASENEPAILYTPVSTALGAFDVGVDIDADDTLRTLVTVATHQPGDNSAMFASVTVSGEAELELSGPTVDLQLELNAPSVTQKPLVMMTAVTLDNSATQSPFVALGAINTAEIVVAVPSYDEQTGQWDLDDHATTITNATLVGHIHSFTDSDNGYFGDAARWPAWSWHNALHNKMVTCLLEPRAATDSAQQSLMPHVAAFLTMQWADELTPTGTVLQVWPPHTLAKLRAGGATEAETTGTHLEHDLFARDDDTDDTVRTIVGFDCINADSDQGEELIVAVLAADHDDLGGDLFENLRARLFRVDFDQDGNPAQPVWLRDLPSEDLRSLDESPAIFYDEPPIAGLYGGDINGDGVDDLILAEYLSIFTLLGSQAAPGP